MKTRNLTSSEAKASLPMPRKPNSFLAKQFARLRFGVELTPQCRLLFCLVFATAVAWAVGCNDKGDWGGSFSGIVVDSISQAPIDSAWVSLSNSPVDARYTDSAGNFTVPTFGRPQRIYAGKTGYVTKTQSVLGTNVYVTGIKIELAPDAL